MDPSRFPRQSSAAFLSLVFVCTPQKVVKAMAHAHNDQPAIDREDIILAQMGYKQELKRGFDALMVRVLRHMASVPSETTLPCHFCAAGIVLVVRCAGGVVLLHSRGCHVKFIYFVLVWVGNGWACGHGLVRKT
jgi:hypothetical protein